MTSYLVISDHCNNKKEGKIFLFSCQVTCTVKQNNDLLHHRILSQFSKHLCVTNFKLVLHPTDFS